MLSAAKVAVLLMLFGVAALASGEDVEAVPTEVEDDAKPAADTQEPVKEEEGAAKTQEKRGLFRFTGVHGENLQPYQFVYPVPQQAAAYQQHMMPQYEPRAVGSIPPSTIIKPYPMPYAQPTYQQQYVINSPAPAPHVPLPYSSPTTMILLMMPPHHGNPYGSLMLLPYNNIAPQYNPNNIVPNRVPFQFVPQYVPVPVKGYGQAPGFPAAHFKASEYSQKSPVGAQYLSYQDKPSVGAQYLSAQSYQDKPSIGAQYLSAQSYQDKPSVGAQYLSAQSYQDKPSVGAQYLSSQSYQEQPQSSEEQDAGVTSPPNYVSRRPIEYVKG